MITVFTTVESPLGRLLLSGVLDDGPGGTGTGTGTGSELGGSGSGGGGGGGQAALAAVTAPGQKGASAEPAPDWVYGPEALAPAAEQLTAYFAGELTVFDLPLAPRGSEFRQRIWAALDDIPYGATVTYGELAAAAGQSPRAVRAVGGAVGANPLLVVRPCHRVVGAGGALTGFAAGVENKRLLLDLERGTLF